MLEVRKIDTFYAGSQALFGVTLSIEQGQVATLIGRNGMGKTTTVNSIMGIIPVRKGEIWFNHQRINGLPSFKIATAGIGLVPEGRQVFPSLSVRENLIATAANIAGSDDPWILEKVLEFFPGLKQRLDNPGSQLSGGEQQMLAIGRALMINPRLLILDEATEGLAPLVREEIWSRLGNLKDEGQSILVIDKNLEALIQLADHHYIIEKGRIVWNGGSDQLRADPSLKTRYLGV